MAAYSGKEGSVLVDASQEFNELREWSLDYGGNIHEYASRAGGGATQTVYGVDHGSGKIVLNFDQADCPANSMPTGRLVNMTLKCTADGKSCTGQARIGQHHYNPKLSGEEQQVTIDFVTHGFWTLPTH
jgi:hypothetical protein